MRIVCLVFIALVASACAKEHEDTHCQTIDMSFPYLYSDGVERKSDYFTCVEPSGRACDMIQPATGSPPRETDCSGDVIIDL